MIYSIIGVAVAVVMALGYWIYKESTGFRVTRYEFKTDKKLEKDIHFVMMADLHDTDKGNNNQVLLDAIDELAPDFVILAGDMVTAYLEPTYNFDKTLEFIGKLAVRYKTFYGYGNHEMRFRREQKRFPDYFKKLAKAASDAGAPLMKNKKYSFKDNNVDIYGLFLSDKFYTRGTLTPMVDGYMDKMLGAPDPDRLSLLIAHNPEILSEYSQWGADYVLSGHVHGGIVRVPFLGGLISPRLKLFPKFDYGIFKEDATTMILTNGIGAHTIPIRINNKAEIVDIRIYGKKD